MFGKKKIQIVTHSGNFHADDVFACATLSLLLDKQGKKYHVTRTRDEQLIEQADYVFDVGGVYDPEKNRFDHHQTGGAATRENGIPYASAGLVWKKFGAELTGSPDVADALEKSMVVPIDAIDTAVDIAEPKFEDVYHFSFQTIINAFRPQWQEKNLTDDMQFFKMVDMTKAILERAIISAQFKQESREIVEKAYQNAEDKRVVIFETPVPRDVVISVLSQEEEPIYFVYPKSTEGWWKAEGVPKDKKSFALRKPFPEEWAGKRDEEFAKITGIADAKFCHNGQFLIVAVSKESVLTLVKRSLAL